ncbi:MAG: hypothetical protein JW888_18345 [Pirellulales bacterium]|nr:hypothetical protein [Pirellulales bacterium]
MLSAAKYLSHWSGDEILRCTQDDKWGRCTRDDRCGCCARDDRCGCCARDDRCGCCARVVRRGPIVCLFTFLVVLAGSTVALAGEPPALNPFGPRTAGGDGAVPGYVELSDGSVHCGMVYLTRDARLKLYDDQLKRQREIPLRVVKQIDCRVKREWMEKQWRFKETTTDEKMVTGRSYPAREYLHAITLRDDRKIEGPLSAVVYLRPENQASAGAPPSNDARRFLLHKRDKGPLDTDLKSLVYVRTIKLGEEALEEGRRKALKRKTRLKKESR